MTAAREGSQRGSVVAAALAGAWRPTPPPLLLSPADLAEIAPALLERGASGLAWWRLRRSELRTSAPARDLRQAYRYHTLQAVLHEEHIPRIVSLLRAAGVEPLLIKGWATARLYPQTGLRPYGDIDLCVRPEQMPAALAVLKEAAGRHGRVDLHDGVPDLTDRTWKELYRRSRLVPLGAEQVRILGPEDQLRQLCLHFWRHNACRPLWLCDIGAALEALPPDFDWDWCLRGSAVPTSWFLCVVGLACRLLGARLDGPARVERAGNLPSWLVPAVLWKWGSPWEKRSFVHVLRRPVELPGAIRYRWFDPIKATFRMRLRAHHPMLLTQYAALLGRLVEVARRLQRFLGKRRRDPEQAFDLHLRSDSRFL